MFEIAVTLKPSSFSWFAVAKKLGRNECWKGGKQTDIWKTKWHKNIINNKQRERFHADFSVDP